MTGELDATKRQDPSNFHPTFKVRDLRDRGGSVCEKSFLIFSPFSERLEFRRFSKRVLLIFQRVLQSKSIFEEKDGLGIVEANASRFEMWDPRDPNVLSRQDLGISYENKFINNFSLLCHQRTRWWRMSLKNQTEDKANCRVILSFLQSFNVHSVDHFYQWPIFIGLVQVVRHRMRTHQNIIARRVIFFSFFL